MKNYELKTKLKGLIKHSPYKFLGYINFERALLCLTVNKVITK